MSVLTGEKKQHWITASSGGILKVGTSASHHALDGMLSGNSGLTTDNPLPDVHAPNCRADCSSARHATSMSKMHNGHRNPCVV